MRKGNTSFPKIEKLRQGDRLRQFTGAINFKTTISVLPCICIHSEIAWDSKSRDFEHDAGFDLGLIASYVNDSALFFFTCYLYIKTDRAKDLKMNENKFEELLDYREE